MKNKTIPITSLRDTGKIDELVNSSSEPIYVTKNGYDDFMIIPKKVYGEMGEKNTYSESNNLGYVRVKCASIDLQVGDLEHNCECVQDVISKSIKEKVSILCFPQRTFTGSTVEDFYNINNLDEKIDKIIAKVQQNTIDKEIIVIVGIQKNIDNCLTDIAVTISKGAILGISGPICRDFPPDRGHKTVQINGKIYPIFSNVVFENLRCGKINFRTVVGDINNGFLSNNFSNTNIVFHLGSSKKIAGSTNEQTSLINSYSKIYNCAYCFADTSLSESTNDFVSGGNSIISECGHLLGKIQKSQMSIIKDIDLDLINSYKIKNSNQNSYKEPFNVIHFELINKEPKELLREVKRHEFIPNEANIDDSFINEILFIQAKALANRMSKIGCKKAVIGLSGGLDSTLALIATVESFKLQKLPLSEIHVFSLPSVATSERTRGNGLELAKQFGVSYKEINISKSIEQHLKDLEIDESNRSVAYENAQARERTQILMDYANLVGGIVVGTGDLSELALGWCTYNGDHMSMYAVNAGIPKTLIRYIVNGYANRYPKLKAVLKDILDTPISPELIPGTDNKIVQLTEDKIGPYDLQDFYIYNYLKYYYNPKKLYYLAKIAFKDTYSDDVLKKWLKVFIHRFYISQFKRTAVPDGPAVLDISLSPRGGLRLPSDLNVNYLLEEIDQL